jgi:hypothetical protein
MTNEVIDQNGRAFFSPEKYFRAKHPTLLRVLLLKLNDIAM